MNVCHWCGTEIDNGRKFCSHRCRGKMKTALAFDVEPATRQTKRYSLRMWMMLPVSLNYFNLPPWKWGDSVAAVRGWQKRTLLHS